MSAYTVPAGPVEREIEIKKSRFIARADRVRSREEALALVARARRDHPDARHHCWAYLLGNPEAAGSAAMNDDGEPSGTAGKPILNVMRHKGIGDVMVVVIRYFGGIKLGAGGLVRAYSSAAEAALSSLVLERRTPVTSLLVEMDFALEQAVRHWAAEHDAEIGEPTYGESVRLPVTLALSCLQELEAFCLARGIAIHPSE